MINQWIDSLNKDIISVIIPTYNRHKYFACCLRSLAACEMAEKLEIIVVEDGSDDFNFSANKNLIDAYINCDMDIKYIRLSENTGTVSIPRNIGISHASGRTIAPTDDDCFPSPKKFQLFNDLWTNEKNVLAFGNREEYSCTLDGDVFPNPIHAEQKFPHYATTHKKEVGLDNGQFIYKTDVYKDIKPVFAINACDWELYKNIADLGDFVYRDFVVSKYLWHHTNISRTPKHRRVNPLAVLPNFLEYFKPNEFTDACINSVNL